MATLAQQRAAIRQGITDARRATGEAERDAIGQRLIAERRGTEVVEDFNRLQQPASSRRTLRTVPPVGPLGSQVGRGIYTPPPTTTPGTGGGIASPLTEVTKVEGGFNVPDRTFHASITSPTSDGIFTMILKPIASLKFTDANAEPAQFDLAAPQTPVAP